MPEDALTKIAGEEEAVGAPVAQGGEETEFGDGEILALVDDGEVALYYQVQRAASEIFVRPGTALVSVQGDGLVALTPHETHWDTHT